MLAFSDLLNGRFWRWMLLSRLFTHASHDLKADVPNLAVKTKRRPHIFSYAPVSTPISGWKWFGGTCNASRLMPTTSHDSTTRNVSMCIAHKHGCPQPLPNLKKRNNCCERLVLATVKRTKKTYRPRMRINFDHQNAQFGLFSVLGWV